jgi:hypothetical protein
MKRPLTRVLIKIVAKGFYQTHTGLLLSLFILIVINFFYTPVLNQTHLTPDQITRNALKLVLASVSEPLGVLLFFGLLGAYSLKSGQYVARRLAPPDVQFLFYSTNALSRTRQLGTWSIVQLVIALPVISLGLFALLIGMAFGYGVIALLIPVYLLALILGNAFYYTQLVNVTANVSAAVPRRAWLSQWPKPLFSLFVYELLDKKRIPFLITKILSFLSIGLLLSLFADAHTDPRLFGLIGLCVALVHSLLIYQSSEFEQTYLRFARNFPLSQWQLYGQSSALYSLLVLPEIIWLLLAGGFSFGLLGVLLIQGQLLLLRSLLYPLGQRPDGYRRWTFGLFVVGLFGVVFGLTEILAISSVVVAGWLTYRYRYGSLE